ncbi:MAG: 2-oxo-4-hydroxy-4-carboxy-5-ureidoimidazoline decarboxylase [Candidatus Solibacter sp.]
MTLEAINGMDRAAFVEALGWVFEHSPWVAERAWAARPFADLAELHQAMTAQVAAATLGEQLALMRAHPDLGTRAKMSESSVGEQAGAGLDRLTREEFEGLQKWNAAYREKFGFPFLYAVKNSTKYDVLRALEERLSGGREEEGATALAQIYRIAQSRLEDTVHA